ncbi:MAG: hypothetical protein IJQ07_03275 [Clostridia bacterium]|nr:hypothetical protein [Clostridia bacterium]
MPDITKIIEKVQNDKNINIEVKNLIRRNEERLLAVKEFSPFFKKNKCNMEIMRLFFVLSDLNDIINSFDYEYKKFNNNIYKNKPRPPIFSEEKLKERIFLLSEKENNPCEELAQLLIFLDKKYIRQIGRKTR